MRLGPTRSPSSTDDPLIGPRMLVDKRKVPPLVFREGDDQVLVQYSNRGDPWREGVELSFEGDRRWVAVLLEEWEVRQLRDKLNEFLGEQVQP